MIYFHYDDCLILNVDRSTQQSKPNCPEKCCLSKEKFKNRKAPSPRFGTLSYAFVTLTLQNLKGLTTPFSRSPSAILCNTEKFGMWSSPRRIPSRPYFPSSGVSAFRDILDSTLSTLLLFLFKSVVIFIFFQFCHLLIPVSLHTTA